MHGKLSKTSQPQHLLFAKIGLPNGLNFVKRLTEMYKVICFACQNFLGTEKKVNDGIFSLAKNY